MFFCVYVVVVLNPSIHPSLVAGAVVVAASDLFKGPQRSKYEISKVASGNGNLIGGCFYCQDTISIRSIRMNR